MKHIGFYLLLLACSTGCRAKVTLAPPPAAEGASIYQLPGQWSTQDNRTITLDALLGRPQMVAMIYTRCGAACPRMVAAMKAIQDSLPAPARAATGFVLVSLDPQRDTPEQLRDYAVTKQLDHHWVLLQGNAGEVRMLSMTLDVRYRQLGDGSISHSSDLFILDKQGRVVRSVALQDIDAADVVRTIKSVL